MHIIPIAELTVPSERQRRIFDETALQELSDSIEKLGLMQPLVVRFVDGQATLVAGERRLRAVGALQAIGAVVYCNNSPLPEGTIACVDIGELSVDEAFEAELEENIRRANLTWQEQAAAIAALHALRSRQSQSHTVTATAIEVTGRGDGDYRAKTKAQIVVADYLHDPEVAKAKDAKEALKIIVRKEQVVVNTALAELVGDTYGAHSHTLLKGDCLQVMAQMAPATFDVVITDPPYGMGADEFGDGAGKLVAIEHGYDDSQSSFRRLLVEASEQISRVCKPEAHLYICCDLDQFAWLRQLFTDAGWSVFRTPIINEKVNSGRVPLPEHGPRRTYEIILYAFRGGKRVTGIYPDVMHTQGDEQLGHGAQKPIAMYADLLRRSARPGDRVLDPFAGTGTIFPAAHAHKVYATGIERDENSFGIAARRLAGLDAQGTLPTI